MDNATAPYDASDYAYAWQVNYPDFTHPTSVSVVVNGVVQATRPIYNSAGRTRFGLELSADGSELYLLMTLNRHNGLVTNHGSVGSSTPIDQDTVSYVYRGHVRYFDGSPVADPSSYTANTLENWNLTSSNTNTSHLIYTGTPTLYYDGGLLYRATGLSLPTNRSIVITDRMVDYQKPTQSSAFPKIKNNFSTKGSRATDGFSKRTGVFTTGANFIMQKT